MTHHHPHTHLRPSAGMDLKFQLGLILNTGFTVFEFVVGIMSGSLALVSDAGHNLTDSLSLLIAFVAEKFGHKRADANHSYGHKRATIIAALFNSSILVLLALFIFYSAVQRFLHPEPVSGGLVMVVAFVGILINGSIAWLFSKNQDLHIRSAFLSMAFDTLASIGALAAGIFIYFTGQTVADPIASVVIGIMLLVSAGEVIGDSLHILLEGVPKGIDVNEVTKTIAAFPQVRSYHELHIWSLSSNDVALSCHLVLNNCTLAESTQINKDLKAKLKSQFGIETTTIEVEVPTISSPKLG